MSMGREYLADHAYEIEKAHKEKERVANRPIFSRGYGECRERLASNPHFTRSCFNCFYYYQASGDKEEVCQNDKVLEYDMVVQENSIFCTYWKPSSVKSKELNLFKSGRSRLD